MKKEEIFNLIVLHCCNVLPILKEHSFQRADRLKDLGANSLDRTEILEMTMETLDLNVPRVEIFGAANIGELTDLLYEKSVLTNNSK